jgi:hypothetical protein
MAAATELDGLKQRHRRMLRWCVLACGLSAVTLLAALAHFETGAGAQFSDVHVPADWLRPRRLGTFQLGEPYPVGLGIAKVVQWILFIAFTGGQLAALACLVWAMSKKRREIVLPVLLILIVLGAVAPVPKVMSRGIAEAVSVETAQALVQENWPRSDTAIFKLAQRFEDEATAYVRAQIAYVQGNQQQARALVANIDTDDLSSPIEAPYRMQFLRSRPEGRSTVCFITFGCLSEADAHRRFLWLALGAAVATLMACGLGLTCVLLGERVARADALAIQGAQLKLSRVLRTEQPMQRSVK